MESITTSGKTVLERLKTFFRNNAQVNIGVLLFLAGSAAMAGGSSALGGALYGAFATLLGSWVTEQNTQFKEKREKEHKQQDAIRYLTPELNRTIERVLYIHGRANANFVSAASVDRGPRTNDLKYDFLPYKPILYPTVPQFHDLTGEKAAALVAFYDSLNTLDKFVEDWWAREGQLPVNVFNMILHHAHDSMGLALKCIEEFGLEASCPPRYAGWDTITVRIEKSMSFAEEARKHHIEQFEAKRAKPAQQQAV